MFAGKVGCKGIQLTGSDANATWQIAGEARKGGYEASLVPSAAIAGSKNLVIFPDRAAARPIVRSSKNG